MQEKKDFLLFMYPYFILFTKKILENCSDETMTKWHPCHSSD